MNPIQHGEVFVTDDGAETDLDLGHYERFVDENLTVNSSVSSGKVYTAVLDKEREGEFLGRTVQVLSLIHIFYAQVRAGRALSASNRSFKSSTP